VALIAALGALGLPTAVNASNWWWHNGNVVHLNRGHNPTLTLFNNATNGSATAIEHARGDWSGASWAMDIGNWASASADVIAWDGAWCTPWSGIATPVTGGVAGSAHADGHVDQMWIQINTCSNSYASGANYAGTRMVACHELGHATAGEWEGTSEGAPGCVSGGYVAGTDVNIAAWRSPSQHDLDHANWLWSVLH
jgi:hypothetical protein